MGVLVYIVKKPWSTENTDLRRLRDDSSMSTEAHPGREYQRQYSLYRVGLLGGHAG